MSAAGSGDERVNVLGLVESSAGPMPGLAGEPYVFLDFTVDGRPLGHYFVTGDDMTALSHDFVGDDFWRTNVCRLLGDDVPMPTFEVRWAEKPIRILGFTLRAGIPYALLESVFEDGRVVLTYCPCGDLDCGSLSTRVEATDETVTWRDTWFQVGYEPVQLDGDSRPRTFTFNRSQYEAVLRPLLEGPLPLQRR